MKLTPEQRRQFREDGFLSFQELFDSAEIQVLANDIPNLTDCQAEGKFKNIPIPHRIVMKGSGGHLILSPASSHPLEVLGTLSSAVTQNRPLMVT